MKGRGIKGKFKRCGKCKKRKRLSEFYRHRTRGHQGRCKQCINSPGARRHRYERWGRARHFKRQYGITMEEYRAILRKQRNRCAICRGIYKLVVDHCHKTKKVRGILCDSCNIAIGRLDDDPKFIRRALLYLERKK